MAIFQNPGRAQRPQDTDGGLKKQVAMGRRQPGETMNPQSKSEPEPRMGQWIGPRKIRRLLDVTALDRARMALNRTSRTDARS